MTESEEPPPHRPKRVIDARSLRGLAHPLRMKLLQLLRLDGPATATGLAARLGENTGTTSWHLRQLAEHGFITEDPDRGSRRERWWRAVDQSTVLRGAEFLDDPDTRGPLQVVLHEYLNHSFGLAAAFLAEVDQWAPGWLSASTMSDWDNLRLTPDRLRRLNDELIATVDRYRDSPDTDSGTDSGTDADPASEPVIVQLQSFPRHRRAGS
ncbi:MAG TPA: winged helix-turn-helix domain-containing protein [Mycobacteriales bacterium]|nr:winged helix-turn-helix domain-containing protein [Mycobacteriales bacterium]